MEKHPTLADGWQQIQRTALDVVADERQRHITELGYSYDHDDGHVCEELAAAAAFFLLPEHLNLDVCSVREDYTMRVCPLNELIGEEAWNGIHRDNYEDPAIRFEVAMDTRINQLVMGLSLGLAELERWMRMRELRDQAEKG